MVKYADAYLRYSTHMQDEGFSIEYQMADVEKYCAENNIIVKNWYIDTAKSAGKTAGRKNFEKYLDTLYEGTSNEVFIVWSTNRLFRNAGESRHISRVMKANKVTFKSATQEIDIETDAGQLVYDIFAIFDERKISETSEQVRAAQRYMISQKLFAGGSIPFGFKLEPIMHNGKKKKRLVLCEKTAPIVRKAFEMVANGSTIFSAHRYINQNIEYSYNSMNDLLQNVIYIGTKVYGKKDPIVVEDYCEAIVDKDTFEAVQKIMSDNKEKVKGRMRKNNYLLTGSIKCGCCGFSYIGHTTQQANYYRCNGTRQQYGCKNRSVRKDELEKTVFQAILDNLLSESAINSIVNDVTKNVEKSETRVEDKKDLLKQQTKLQKDIAELVQMKLNGEIDGETMVFMKKPKEDELSIVKNKIREIETFFENQIDLSKVKAMAKKVFDVNRSFESCDDDTLKTLFNQTVEKIIIEKTQVIIHLRLNLSSMMFKASSRDCYHRLNIKISREELKR